MSVADHRPVIIDLHSHVLPGIDDGSRDIKESLSLLRLLSQQKVEIVCATPHFYTHKCSIQDFLNARKRAAESLKNAMSSDLPELRLGGEIYYFDGISRSTAVRDLTIEGTPLLLVEMPFGRWSQRMISDLISLNSGGTVRVLLAHVERYLLLEPSSAFTMLLQNGILMQSNADFFLSRYGKRMAPRMLLSGRIHALGSDCHNTVTRPPRIDEALEQIQTVDGGKALLPLYGFCEHFFRT